MHLQHLCNYLQDAADANANALDFGYAKLLEDNKAWVLARLRLVLHRMPRFGETITVYTWPQGGNKLYGFRQYRVEAGDELLARGASAWPIVDLTTRTAVRMSDQVRDMEPPEDAPEELGLEPDKVSDIEEPVNEVLYPVRHMDLDYNGHVNNAVLSQWLVEGAQPLVPAPWRLREVRVRYRAELRFGESAMSKCSSPRDLPDGGRMLHHVLSKEPDGSELTTAMTIWRQD